MPDAMPPQPPQPAPQPPAAPAKKGPPKLLIGCVGALVVVGLGMSICTAYVKHKVNQFSENPGMAMAKMVVAANKDLEIVSSDEAKQTITIRDKKSGEVLTVNAGDLQNGKLELKNGKGETVTFDGKDTEKGGVTISSKEGTTTLGTDSKAPSWLPAYPGAKSSGVMASNKADGGAEGIVSYTTKDPSDKVLDFYQQKLEGAGYKVERTNMSGDKNTMGVIQAKTDAREVNVTANTEDDKTEITVQYTAKK
jgi:hypothetical protein